MTNTGELSGTYDVNLKIDDTVEATEKVTLAAGLSQNVTFTKTKFTAKTYSVSIDDQSSSFLVKSAPPPSTPPLSPSIEWGPQYATPGTRVDLLKNPVASAGLPVGGAYNLRGVGLPKDKVYYLWTKRYTAGAEPKQHMRVKVDDQGFVFMSWLPGPQEEQYLTILLSEGETIEVALISEDKAIVAFGKFP